MINLEYSYLNLPPQFYSKTIPTSGCNPKLKKYNNELASFLNINFQNHNEKLSFLAGNLKNSDNIISMNYAGHQFGHFNPQLGDGRAALLGELIAKDGLRYDLHLKGCGKTNYSRGGDGRSYIGPAIREYLVSEAMHSLGISTTRALSLILTGETVVRERSYPGASIIRIAKGHIRVGSFEYFLYRHMIKDLAILIDYSINRFAPELVDHPNRNFLFFEKIAKQQLRLVVDWLSVGFIHGVMNTDNMSISGETLDYGPCAFMDYYKSDKKFSSIDQNARYAYNKQSEIAFWNLSSLANCFIAADKDPREKSKEYIELFEHLQDFYKDHYLKIFCNKLGIVNPRSSDIQLIQSFLQNMEDQKLDFTNTFYALPKQLDSYAHLKSRINEESIDESMKVMKRSNPYIIPRNHLIQKAIDNAILGDFEFFEKLDNAFKTPFDENANTNEFSSPPSFSEEVKYTYCGT